MSPNKSVTHVPACTASAQKLFEAETFSLAFLQFYLDSVSRSKFAFHSGVAGVSQKGHLNQQDSHD